MAQALRLGASVKEIHAACKYDPWFIREIADIVETEEKIRARGLPKDAVNFRQLKAMGFSDRRLAEAHPARARTRCAPIAMKLGVQAGLQAHRHLRRRIRLAHRLYVFDL